MTDPTDVCSIEHVHRHWYVLDRVAQVSEDSHDIDEMFEWLAMLLANEPNLDAGEKLTAIGLVRRAVLREIQRVS